MNPVVTHSLKARLTGYQPLAYNKVKKIRFQTFVFAWVPIYTAYSSVRGSDADKIFRTKKKADSVSAGSSGDASRFKYRASPFMVDPREPFMRRWWGGTSSRMQLTHPWLESAWFQPSTNL
jgi:hypothetical protein